MVKSHHNRRMDEVVFWLRYIAVFGTLAALVTIVQLALS